MAAAIPRPRRAERGFTLLEIAVATFIFIIGFTSVMYLNAASIDYTRLSSDISLASNLAANTIEELRVDDYDTIAPELIYYEDDGTFITRIPYQDSVAAPDGTFFTVTTTVTEEATGAYKDVEAEANWVYPPSTYEHGVSMQSRLIE